MSWGIRITVLYLGFVALILTLVFTSMHNKEDLVSKDYYLQELKFQERINATANESELSETITHTINGHTIELVYPGGINLKDLSGEIYFFRPSDAEKDLRMEMRPNTDGMQMIDGKSLIHGMYKMQLTWKLDGRQYFKEDVIFIQ